MRNDFLSLKRPGKCTDRLWACKVIDCVPDAKDLSSSAYASSTLPAPGQVTATALREKAVVKQKKVTTNSNHQRGDVDKVALQVS